MSLIRYTVVAVFDEAPRAGRAIQELRARGFREDQIGVVPPEAVGGHLEEEASAPLSATVAGAAGAGVITGATIGGLVGGPPAMPAAALAGGAVGGLIGLGVPEEEARYYQRELEAGRTIVAVNSDGRYDEAVAILRGHGGHLDESPLSQAGPGALP